MQSDAASPKPDLLSQLREATGPSHERLDASFGSLDLARRHDLARFLAAHAIGLAPLFPVFRAFVEGELGLSCPDYPAMLAEDLAALGVDAQALPVLDVPAAIAPPEAAAGVGYVICGSRLGLAMIRQRGYWGEAEGFRSAYMTDGRGHEAWKALVPHLRGRAPADATTPRDAALAAFDTFSAAFAASAGVRQPADG
ncbi:MAG TPA: biliverdin-producing heme oxygenase [Novosphingobium sp.]|nr:biliverdin-producing heme oxygenase [Novosphingobium sp.]